MAPLITGLQHVGIGVPDVVKARRQYYALHNMQLQLADVVGHSQLPHQATGGNSVLRRLIHLLNLGGGGGYQLVQLLNTPTALPEHTIAFGQPGINAVFLRCFDHGFTEANHRHFHIPLLPLTNPLGQRIWQGEDLYDNRFRFVPGDQPFGPGDMGSGGVAGALVGVTNMDRALPFYQQVLGFEKVLYDETGQFADLPGAQQARFRRVLLYKPAAEAGALCRLLGDGCIELIQKLDGPARPHFYAGRSWGQPGLQHLCFETPDLPTFLQQAATQGWQPVVQAPQPVHYQRVLSKVAFGTDPDGTVMAFSQTLELPWYRPLGLKLTLATGLGARPVPNWKLGLLSSHRIGAKELAK